MTETVFGRYRLHELLGQGGMGEVYRAFDTETNRMVALKVLPHHLLADKIFRERFLREANAAAGLTDPHVVPIHGFGEIEDRLYLDMRLVEGIDLHDMLRERGAFDPERAVNIVSQVASALESAHRIGLIHRDVKPSNVLITKDDFAYLIDFGIARAAGETSLTGTGGMIGTLAYMAPERFKASEFDARADVYALACVLYECLTGQQPFPGSSVEQQLAAHLTTPPPRPSQELSHVPAALDGVIARGMAKDPQDRYRSTQDLAREAKAALTATMPSSLPSGNPTLDARHGRTTGTRDPGGPGFANLPTQHRAPQQVPAIVDNQNRAVAGASRNKPLMFVALSAVALVVVGSILAWGLSGSDGASTSTTSRATPGPGSGVPAIVAKSEIDENGAVVNVADGAVPLDPAGDGTAQCPRVSLAMAGALTGPDAALGINIKNGVQLAVDTHNTANPACQVQLKAFDTQGDRQNAASIAPQIVEDGFIVGLIGPAFSGETYATGNTFNQADLVAATASATNVVLSEQGWRTFFRGLVNDGVQGPSVANYLKNTLSHKKVCVVHDSTDYGLGLAQAVRATLGPVADSACNISVMKGDIDFSAAVTQIVGVGPDSVFFSGYYSEAAPFVQQLKGGGFKGTFVSADGTKDPAFVDMAGEASNGAILACPCGPVTGSFAETYSKKFGQEPGTYSAEGYDLAAIMLKGIDSGNTTRAALLEFVRTYDGQGVARKYRWSATGELSPGHIWIYEVQ